MRPAPAALLLAAACSEAAIDSGAGGDADPGPRSAGERDAGASGRDGRTGGAGRDGSAADGGTAPAGADCAPLPPPAGPVIEVVPAQAADLPGIVAGAAEGTTLLLADGSYPVATLALRTPGVTLRSASGDRDAVVLDGEYRTGEIVYLAASDVTVAHLTITRAVDHPVHVVPPDGGPDVTGTLLYDLRIVDGGEQFVKVNPPGARDAWADRGRVECSSFELTDAGRPHVEPCCGGCYTGGIDAHAARGWVVRLNSFRGIFCDTGLAEHAVHFWVGSRDTLVERNTIVDCARGVGFGLVADGAGRDYPDDPYPGAGFVGHYDGVIRNNVIVAETPRYDTGIELAQARGARVLHNTVVEPGTAFSSIDYRFPDTDVTIRNNLVRRITVRDGASGTVDHNLETDDRSLFAGAAAGDFHLAPGAAAAIDQGLPEDDAGLDLDGEPHTAGAAPDLGADELSP